MTKAALLEIPEIVAKDLSNDGFKGKELTIELVKVIQEMQMPNTEVVHLGGTVFITHYTENKKYGSVRILSAESEKEVVTRFEEYIRIQMTRDVQAIATVYTKPKAMKPLFDHLQKMRMVEVHTAEQDDGTYVSMLMLGNTPQKEPAMV